MASARDVFGRATQKGLSVLGEPSLLGGQPCGNVHVARGVQVFAGALDQANDNHVAHADVATVRKTFTPKVGMVLQHPSEGRLELSRLLDDNGYVRRFVVVQLPP